MQEPGQPCDSFPNCLKKISFFGMSGCLGFYFEIWAERL